MHDLTAFVARFNILRIGVEAGDPIAQVDLGIAFENGDYPGSNKQYTEDGGVTWRSSDGLAIHWYRAAAEAGNADGQWRLGESYRLGVEVEKNDAEAREWYRKAADQGHMKAQAMCDLVNYDEESDSSCPDDEDEDDFENEEINDIVLKKI